MTAAPLVEAVLAADLAPTAHTARARLRDIARHALNAASWRSAPGSVLVDLLAVLTWREAVIRGDDGIDGRTLTLDELAAIWRGWGVSPVGAAVTL